MFLFLKIAVNKIFNKYDTFAAVLYYIYVIWTKTERWRSIMEERTIVSFDYAIKYLLRDKADFVILDGFLSELLKRKVEVQAILESESNKVNKDAKTNCVDLRAQIDGGEIVVFEIQFLREIDFFGRILYGVSSAIVEQVSINKRYDIKKVYSINIAYYGLGAVREYLFYGKLDSFRGVNFQEESIPFAQARGLTSGTADSIVNIHPEYYLILPEIFDERLRGGFDQWIYVLKNSAVRSDFEAAGIKEASVKLDLLKMPSAERTAYEKFLENRASLDCVVRTAIMDGHAEGRAEGRAVGRAKGHVEGEKQKAWEIAKKLKTIGIPIQQIIEATGMTEDEIAKL
jgi:hypothetical protein